MNNLSHLIRGILLIAGTAIGGGILGLPVFSSQAGFFPSLIAYFTCWLFMASTGLLFLEISLWMGKDANIISMAENTLGKPGKIFAWLLYLFLFYCLTLAYIVGLGGLLTEVLNHWIVVSQWQGKVLFLLICGPMLYAGAHFIGKFNLFLMLGLGLSFLTFIILGYKYVNTENLLTYNWKHIWTALPIIFTAFSYQGIIPTLVSYLNRDIKQIRLSIIIGSLLPFVAYIIWQWLILGIIPTDGPGGLNEALAKGQNAIQPLKNILDAHTIYIVGGCFAFFALITSFFGVTLGLMDFFADGLNIKKTPKNKVLLCLLIFIPPFIISLYHPYVFLTALDYAGGIGCALLLGLLPIIMTWVGRYKMGLKGEYRFFGGRVVLSILLLFVLIELFTEFSKIFRTLM